MAAWTRRGVLGAGAAAAAAGRSSAEARARPRPSPRPFPRPCSRDVFRERQASCGPRPRRADIDAIFVTPSTNLAWSANLAIGRSERLTALLLFTDGPALLVTPSFEEANHKRTAVVDEVKTWNEDQDPMAARRRRRSPEQKTIGVEGSTAYATAPALGAAASGRSSTTRRRSSTRCEWSSRSRSRPSSARRRAGRTLAIDATHKRMRAGMTESEVARILEEEFANQGVRGGGLVQFGPSSAFPHGAPAERRLAKGDVVLIDCGCRVRGYTSDITRTVVVRPAVRRAPQGLRHRRQGAANAGIERAEGRNDRRGRGPRRAQGDRGRGVRRSTSRTASATASVWTGTSRRISYAATRARSWPATP